METSARLQLPMIVPGQAQKEMTHNEALTRLDIAVQCAVEAALDQPPANPQAGQCWIVGESPTHAWAGQAAKIAYWGEGGWRFLAPVEGFSTWVRDRAMTARWAAGEWNVGAEKISTLTIDDEIMLSSPYVAIADPAGGATVDVAAREVIGEILALLRHHNLMRAA